jgi:Tol biopolymer transport system component
MDIFLRDRSANVTTLVSVNLVGTGGGNGDSDGGALSTDGRFVVFQSRASDLITNDANGVGDIFVRDMVAGTTQLVSAAPDGSPGNGASSSPVITPDGRYVAFLSAASNLVSGDTNGISDVFVRDLTTGTTRLVSVGASLPTGQVTPSVGAPVITSDGRYVGFSSTAKGLAIGTPTNPTGEVYLRDLSNNATIWVSTNAAALALSNLGIPNAGSAHPAVSDDGRFVAFKTGSNALGGRLVLRFDTLTRTNAIVDTNGISLSTPLIYDDVYGPEITPDGRFVTYAHREGVANSSIRVWDGQVSLSSAVSVDLNNNPVTNAVSVQAVNSSDGRYVLFLSTGTNLVTNTVSAGAHVYLRDLQGSTLLVDVDTNGAGSTDDTIAVASMSSDGRYVIFCSPDGSLVSGDNNHADDVFIRDTLAGVTELVSRRDSSLVSQSGDHFCGPALPSISADGQRVAFVSYADDLIPNDTNGTADVFVHDFQAGTNILVTAGTNGLPALGGSCSGATISADGNVVAFISSATNLVAGYTNRFADVFILDLRTGTNVLVSVATNNLGGGDGDSLSLVLSQDGRYVAFQSLAKNLVSGINPSSSNTYWRDTVSNLTVCLTGGSGSANFPSMSADGRYVAYFGAASQLFVRDMQLAKNIYTNSGVVTSAALSPNGARVLYRISNVLYVTDLTTRSNLVMINSSVPIRGTGPWSSDARFIAFVTGTAIGPADSNGVNDVYLYDLLTGQYTLVSFNAGLTGSANGPSDSPAVSGDGRFVAYRSYASDIVPGNTASAPNIFLFDRAAGTNQLVTVAQPQPNWNYWASRPVVARDSSALAFQTTRSLVSNDLNREPDVFADTFVPWVPVDTDGDGIPDDWTQKYFGHPTGQVQDLSRAQDDADGDGLTNLEEYLVGSDPTDPNSFFRLLISPVVSGAQTVSLTWLAMPGRSYELQHKNSLTDQVWSPASGNVVVMGNRGAFNVSAAQPTVGFYRVLLAD